MKKSVNPTASLQINPSLFTKSTDQLAEDLIKGELKAEEIPSKLTTAVQNKLFQRQAFGKMKELSDVCVARLNRKGLVYLNGYGWVKQALVPHMGLANIGGRWVIADVEKYRAYLNSEKKQTLGGGAIPFRR